MKKGCKIITIGGGGIFSVFMDVVILRIYELDFDDFRIEVTKNQYDPPPDCFNFVFDQPDIDEPVYSYGGQKTGGFRKEGHGLGAIEDFADIGLIRNACRKFRIKSEISDKLITIPRNTLGVHFRGGDMDEKHPQYGVFSYDDYRDYIRLISPSQIFIASDNHEVVDRIKNDFDVPVFYYDNFIRGVDVKDDTYDVQMRNANSKIFWQESFIEMLTLARCDSLLCRVSNLANASIAFSDNIKVYRL